MFDVVALGELLIDFATVSTDGDAYPTMAANPGGAPGNFLAALNAYGKKTAFLGKVGNDTFGHLLLKTKNAAFRTPCPKVHPVDTTGAGDIFGGSAVARLLELEKPIGELTEEDLAYIGKFAATAASLSTEAVGGIPNKDAVLAAM